MLIIADSADGVQAQQLEPLLNHTATRSIQIDALIDPLLDHAVHHASHDDAIALQPHFSRTSAQVSNAIALMRDRRPVARISLLDSTDPSAIRWPEAVAMVDVYAKKQLLADHSAHATPSRTGYWFADYCAQTLGWDLHGWTFASTPVPAASLHKLRLAWHLGAADKYRRVAMRSLIRTRVGRWRSWPDRLIDVNCVVQIVNEQDASFYSRHRRAAVDALLPMQRSRNTLLAVFGGSVPPPMSARQYRRSLRRSKLCVSPFGWGEICHREVEAMLCGCLVIKPDMRLVETVPNLFRPLETYVPVRWDLADLAETCERWLGQPAEAAGIAERGRELAQQFLLRREIAPYAKQLHDRLVGCS